MKAILIFLLSLNFAYAQQYIDVKDQFLKEINVLRKKAGRSPVVYSESQQKQCDRWAKLITKQLIHNTRDNFHGEVISQVPASEDLVIGLFMLSDPHKKVLMDRKIKSICLSVYTLPRKQVIHKDGIESIPDMFYTVIRTY